MSIVPSAGGTQAVSIAADGVELRCVGVTGASLGIAVTGATDVSLDRVWVHDTSDVGIFAYAKAGAVGIVDTLVENATTFGVRGFGAALSLDRVVVRAVQADATGHYGVGVLMDPDPNAPGSSASLDLSHSIVEGCYQSGVSLAGASGSLDGVVIRDTHPQPADGQFGRGLTAGLQTALGLAATVTVARSVIEDNAEIGVFVYASDATLSATVVRRTAPNGAGLYGHGIDVARADGVAGNLRVEDCAVTENHDAGIFVVGAKATIERTLIADTAPEVAGGGSGRGLVAMADAASSVPATLEIVRSRFERNHESGIMVVGGDLTMDATAVRDTKPPPKSGGGRGLSVQFDSASGVTASAVVHGSLFERLQEGAIFAEGASVVLEETTVLDVTPSDNTMRYGRGVSVQKHQPDGPAADLRLTSCTIETTHEVGVEVAESSALIEATIVRGVQPEVIQGRYGDGVLALSFPTKAKIDVRGSRIEQNARAGLSSFGGDVTIGGTLFDCNGLALAAEQRYGLDSSFQDVGTNTCGCGEDVHGCSAQSSKLEPPEPLSSRP